MDDFLSGKGRRCPAVRVASSTPPFRAALLAGASLCLLLGCGGAETKEAKSPVRSGAPTEAERPTEGAVLSSGAASSPGSSPPPQSSGEVSLPAPSEAEASTASEPESGKRSPLQELAGLDAVRGPALGPSGPAGASESEGARLTESQIQGTVRQHQSSVKRGCWQEALMTRDIDAPSTARVTVSLRIAASGRVLSASAPAGDPRGYVGLASCITSRVRVWTFPQAGGTTTVNLPFVFAAQ